MGYFTQIRVVCCTCTRRIGQFWIEHAKLKKKGLTDQEIFDKFGFIICCRRSFLGSTNRFHDTERREVVDGEYPPNNGPSYLSRDKNSLSKIQKFNSDLSSRSTVPISWENKEMETKKTKTLLKENVITKSKIKKEKLVKEDLLFGFNPLPKVEKIKDDNQEENEEEYNAEDDEIVYDDLIVDGDTNKINTNFIMPSLPGFPTVINPDRIGKDDSIRYVTVGFIEKGGERIEMKTAVLNQLIYLAE